MTTATIQTNIRSADAPSFFPLPVLAGVMQARTERRSITAMEVRELLDAAGPLSTQDIAGGLDVSTHTAATLVAEMVERGWLRADEWQRYRLWGALRDAA